MVTLKPDPHAPLSEIYPLVDAHTGHVTGEFYAVIKHRGAPWQPVRFPSSRAAVEWCEAYKRGEVGPAHEPEGVEVVHHHCYVEDDDIREDDYLDDEGTDDYDDIQLELGDR